MILDRVFLQNPWRGFGLGPALAAEAIRRLADGCCAVAAYPAPSENGIRNARLLFTLKV